jgi:PAS domain S-box-containing protein
MGYSQDELMRMNMRDLIAPEVRDEFDKYLDDIGKHGTARGMTLIRTRKGERRIWEYNNTLRTEGVTEPILQRDTWSGSTFS